ncbi:MAG: sulfotransferase [Sphingomicrobium sp.]
MGQEDWQTLLSEASRLRQAGRVEEAIIAYRRLLKARPDLADSWYNLGFLQRHARQYEAALLSYQRALDLAVTAPEEVHVNRAVIYADHLFRPDEAARELDLALACNPAYVPALLNLGNLREDRGERDPAREAYRSALAAEPDNVLALSRLAGLSHAPDLDRDLAGKLRAELARPGLAADARADAGFALGGLLDAAGNYDQAFAAIGDANAASRSATNARYDRAAHEEYIARLIASFDRPATAVSDGAAPVFICGMFRSGSTLVEQILARHSQVTASGELDLVTALAGSISNYPESVPTAVERTVAAWRKSYLDGMPIQPTAGHMVSDKRPDNFLHLGLIKRIFPRAKIVHSFRNPLDNLLSLYFLHLDPGMAYALDLDDAAHFYGQYRRLMAHWRMLYPDDIIDVDYDQLVRDPDCVLKPLLDALGLPWEEGLLDFHRNRDPVKTASVWQVRQPLHARSSGRWRNYARHFQRVRAVLDDRD